MMQTFQRESSKGDLSGQGEAGWDRFFRRISIPPLERRIYPAAEPREPKPCRINPAFRLSQGLGKSGYIKRPYSDKQHIQVYHLSSERFELYRSGKHESQHIHESQHNQLGCDCHEHCSLYDH